MWNAACPTNCSDSAPGLPYGEENCRTKIAATSHGSSIYCRRSRPNWDLSTSCTKLCSNRRKTLSQFLITMDGFFLRTAHFLSHDCDSEGILTLDQVRSRLISKDDAPLVSNNSVEEGEVYFGQELYSVHIAPLPPTTLSPGGG